MEPPLKSCKFDYLSNLPDSAFHQILCRLHAKDVARLATVSKRCRTLCLSLAFLTFDIGKFRNYNDFFHFSEFIERFLRLRSNGLVIHEFVLRASFENIRNHLRFAGFRIGSWLRLATSYNVQKLSLELEGFGNFTLLPNDVFNCPSLRELELKKDSQFLNLQVISFCRIEVLTLCEIRLPVKFFDWILSCKWLKKLHLDRVSPGIHYVFKITSSTLEHLTIKHLPVKRMFHPVIRVEISADRLKYLSLLCFNTKQSLRLRAPKLQQFYWEEENAIHYSYEGNFESMQDANISIYPGGLIPISVDVPIDGIVVNILQSIYRVSSFRVPDYFLKGIYLQKSELPEFCNLHTMTLLSHHWDSTIPSIAFFLNLTPYLTTFIVHLGPGCSSDDMITNYDAAYWESQNLKFVNSLKEVEIEINGEQNEIELIKYLLKNAKVLDKITILYSPCVLPKCSVIRRKLQQFKKAAASIDMFFLPK